MLSYTSDSTSYPSFVIGTNFMIDDKLYRVGNTDAPSQTHFTIGDKLYRVGDIDDRPPVSPTPPAPTERVPRRFDLSASVLL